MDLNAVYIYLDYLVLGGTLPFIMYAQYTCTINIVTSSHMHLDKDGEPPHYEALLDHADHDFVMKLELLSNPGSDLQKPNQHHKSLYKSHRKNTKSNMQQSAATTPTGTAKSSKKTGTKNKITMT